MDSHQLFDALFSDPISDSDLNKKSKVINLTIILFFFSS